MSTTTQSPKPKRRWYQFSLLTLLVVVVLSTVVVGWMNPTVRQRLLDRLDAFVDDVGAKEAQSFQVRQPFQVLQSGVRDRAGEQYELKTH